MEVTAQAPLIQSETTEVDTLITRRDVTDLPLNGRTVFQLAPLVAGATTGSPNSNANNTNIPDNGRANQGLSASGNRQDTNTYILDGVYNNQLNQGLIAILPPLEAIQEFTLVTSNFLPEVGRGGIVMNVTLKSGTNQFHGSAFDFLRNSSLDAANYFDHPTPQDPATAASLCAQPIRRFCRRSHLEEQNIFLRGLSGNTREPGADIQYRGARKRHPDRRL